MNNFSIEKLDNGFVVTYERGYGCLIHKICNDRQELVAEIGKWLE